MHLRHQLLWKRALRPQPDLLEDLSPALNSNLWGLKYEFVFTLVHEPLAVKSKPAVLWAADVPSVGCLCAVMLSAHWREEKDKEEREEWRSGAFSKCSVQIVAEPWTDDTYKQIPHLPQTTFKRMNVYWWQWWHLNSYCCSKWQRFELSSSSTSFHHFSIGSYKLLRSEFVISNQDGGSSGFSNAEIWIYKRACSWEQYYIISV